MPGSWQVRLRSPSQRPSLHNLRRSLRFFDRLSHRYYGAVQVLRAVHIRLAGFSPSRIGLLAQTPQRSPGFSCKLFLDVLRFFDYAGPDGNSRLSAAHPYGLPTTPQVCARNMIYEALFPNPPIPLSTLHQPLAAARAPLEAKMESLLPSRRALSSPTACRFIPAHNVRSCLGTLRV